MSDIKLVSPMLDNFNIGDPISDHHGIRCCPAMQKDSDEKYIVKVISIPASQVQYDALLLTGICSDKESALAYYNDLANGIADEIKLLQKLSDLEGFLPIEDYQIVPMDDAVGYDVYVLSKYKRTLARKFKKEAMTHISAMNLGLDLCAALSVTRKLGYIYADLKPNNVYISGEQEYRIGDIGFIKLDSLKYASYPDAYRSAYTAPEVTDAYSALNTTIDIYALGVILYQVYNGGVLPVLDENGSIADTPAYADYEMSEIIMKACSFNQENRWQDPIELGQALVAYMQRNGANDTPIVPPVPANAIEDIAVQEESETTVSDGESPQEIPDNTGENPEDQSILDDEQDESAPSEEDADVAYEEVTEEVSDMLAVADELIAHPTPDPVVQPEAIDVPIPAPIEPEETFVSEENTNEVLSDEEGIEASAEEEIIETANENSEETDSVSKDEETVSEDGDPEAIIEEAETEVISDKPSAPKKKASWWKVLLITLLVAGIGVAGYFYYTLCYLQPVSMELSGVDNKLTVSVDCAVTDLFVTCTDAYGNLHKELVVDSKAEFNDLAPNTAYTVTVGTSKFFKLTGTATTTYQTSIQTKIAQFTVVNGAEAGTVIASFSVEGTDSEQWRLYYGQAGGTEESTTFSGHMITLSNLNIGNAYTFRLEPLDDLYFESSNAVTFTPSVPVQAEKLSVTGYTDNSLTVTWSTPENAVVTKWIVRCYDETSYNETIETADLTATFEGIEPTNTYTIEVTAEGMSSSAKIAAAEGSLSLKDFTATQASAMLSLSWNVFSETSAMDWIVSYAIGTSDPQELTVSAVNECNSIPYVPNANYIITIKPADGRAVINNQYTFKTESAPSFKNYGVGAEHIHFDMCKTPSNKNWTYRDLSSSDFTTSFSSNSKASFLLTIPYAYQEPDDAILISYVIYDGAGAYVSHAVQENIWGAMWNRGYCELDIPSIPAVAGNYRIAVLFNGELVNESNFTITD